MHDNRGHLEQMSQMPSAWWALVSLSGVLYLAWGLTAVGSTSRLLDGLGLFLGVILLVTATLLVSFAIIRRDAVTNWSLLFIMGLVDLATAAVLLASTAQWVAPIPAVAGLWAIVRGLLEGINALRLRQAEVRLWWAWLVGAIFVLAFGFFALAGLLASTVAVNVWLGCAAIAIGLLTGGLSLLLRRSVPGHSRSIEPPTEHRRAA